MDNSNLEDKLGKVDFLEAPDGAIADAAGFSIRAQKDSFLGGAGTQVNQDIPLPATMRRDRVLEPTDEALLLQQWQEFNRVRTLPTGVNPLQERTSQGRPELAQGTLLHGTFYSPEKMEAIRETGILSGEFIGIVEQDETNYCADFFRVPVDMTVAEYQKWLMEKEIRPGTTVPRNRMER